MKTNFLKSLVPLLILTLFASLALGESAQELQFNKLKEMYHFFYLPFSIDFREGSSVSELFPMTKDKFGEFNELVSPDDIKILDGEWNALRNGWKKKSLLLSTPVAIGESVRISQHIISHRIPLTRTAMDSLSISERVQLTELLTGKTPDVQANVTQLRYVKSFLGEDDVDKFNFFIFSPSWCESSREYRTLLESYFKTFPDPTLTLHSVVIEDLKEAIFDAKIFKELFPHPRSYSHEIVPRFLAIETVKGKTTLYEEGAALSELYERYFKTHRGFLDNKVNFFRNRPLPARNSASLTPPIGKGLKVAE